MVVNRDEPCDMGKVMEMGRRFFTGLNTIEQFTLLEMVLPFFDFGEDGELVRADDEAPDSTDGDDGGEEDEEQEDLFDDEEEEAGERVPVAVIVRAPAKRPPRPPREPLPKGVRPAKWPRDADTIREKLLKLFRDGEELSPKELVERLGRSAWAVRTVLWKMFDEGEVERHGKTNAMKYRLKRAGRG